jgi:hypothetical protein
MRGGTGQGKNRRHFMIIVQAKEFETFIKGLNVISAIEIHAAGSAIIHFDEKKINCEQIIGIP